MTPTCAAGATRPTTAADRLLRAGWCVSLASVLAGAAACESTKQSNQGMSSASTSAGSDVATGSDSSGVPSAAELDARMVIGPTAARSLGYRIAWESSPLAVAPERISIVAPSGDSIFTLDSRNNLSRLREVDGVRIWAAPVGGPYDRALDVVETPSDAGGSEGDRVLVLTEGSLYVVDADNGVLTDRQSLFRPANTPGVLAGPFLIYGGRTGQIVWHEQRVGHHWRVNELEGSIRTAPILAGTDIAAASSAGDLAVMDLRTARTIWSKKLLAGISAPMATGRGFLYVAGLDQYLWAIDVGNGQTIWKHINESPLLTGPTLLGERLYQRIPSRGLVCFDAFVKDRPDGVILWTNAEVPGEVIGERGNAILVWDAPSRTMTRLDRTGGVIETLKLSNVAMLTLERSEGGSIYALADDGRLSRLVPR